MVTVACRWARVAPAEGGLAVLDSGERFRAGRRADPDPFVTAHATVRRLLGEVTGDDPARLAFVRRCATCGSDRHGKPAPVGLDLHISLSYDDHWVLAALSPQAELGVDVESHAATDFDGFGRVFLGDGEHGGMQGLSGDALLRARSRLLSRKEAVLKASGHGLVIDPTSLTVSHADAPPVLLGWSAAQERPEPLTLLDLEPPAPTHAAALAVLTDDAVEVSLV